MRRLAFLLVLLFSLPAFSQAKHPFTFEDMMKLKRVGEPVPSPDGKWVLFSAVDVDLAANTKTPHIWIVPLNSGATSVGAGVSPVPGGSRSASSSPTRTATVRAGRRMASGLRFSRPKKAARRFGLPISTERPALSLAFIKLTFDRDRSRRRTLVARWQAHSLYFGCLSRMRRRTGSGSRMQCEES